ncbi:hypothetical protein FXO38_18157 [Capsicum annuum]|nr:hypothetical protein FXO37_24985 [Capsicum annuum]KAF3648474.1 hypothetical protein FXO38_18157 [Capsicum annuum]
MQSLLLLLLLVLNRGFVNSVAGLIIDQVVEDLKNSTSPALLLVCHDYNAGSKGEMEGITERYSKIMKGSWVDQFRYGSNPWMARYLYSLLFLIANLLAWAVRDYGLSILKEIKRLKGCNGGEDCMGAEGVLRVSLGCS